MVGGDPPKLVVGRRGADAVEERADLPLPALEVGAQDRGFVVAGKLDRRERLRAPAQEQAALAPCAKVANPLRVAAGRDEVARAFERQQVDRRTPWLAGLAPANLED